MSTRGLALGDWLRFYRDLQMETVPVPTQTVPVPFTMIVARNSLKKQPVPISRFFPKPST